MANTLVDMFRMKDIKKKILFTFGILAVTRVGAALPIPGVNPGAVLSYFESNSNSFTEYLNFFSGGAFANFSIFMLGVMPYISTQIIIQLLMLVVPSLKKLAQDPQGTAVYTLRYNRSSSNPVTCSINVCTWNSWSSCYRYCTVHNRLNHHRYRRLNAHGMAW